MSKFAQAIVVAVLVAVIGVNVAEAASPAPDMYTQTSAFATWCKQAGSRKCGAEVLRQLGPDGSLPKALGIGQPAGKPANKPGAEDMVKMFLKLAEKINALPKKP